MAAQSEIAEVERLRRELGEEHDMYLRALADFDNYRRRVERDRAASLKREKRDLMLSMLELMDGFDRALEQGGDASEGLRALRRQLESILDAQGIKPFSSVGETFDPELHEALASDASGEHETGTVTQETRRGYRWGDELLRPARVRVAR